MKKEEYLRCVTDQIRCKKACPGIEKELEDHITDQAEMYLKKGMTEEQALKKAIAEMGDPVQVGVELDRIHRPQMSWGLVLLAGILVFPKQKDIKKQPMFTCLQTKEYCY